MGNNVFVRFSSKNEPEVLVIQSEATPGSMEVTKFVDGTNGGLFLYRNDLHSERGKLVETLLRAVRLVQSAEFDPLVDQAEAAWDARRPHMAARIAGVQGASNPGIVREKAEAPAQSSDLQAAIQEALQKQLGWTAKALERRHRPSGDRRLPPVVRLTLRQRRAGGGAWLSESDELPGILGKGATRASAIANVQSALFRAMAELIENGDADQMRGVVFQIRARQRRKRSRTKGESS